LVEYGHKLTRKVKLL